MTFTKLSTLVSDTLCAFLASRTHVHLYQYKPLLRFLESSNERLLIADEAGLRRTVEAGLILIEQCMRADPQRVLDTRGWVRQVREIPAVVTKRLNLWRYFVLPNGTTAVEPGLEIPDRSRG